ncbi:mechanosensitive ion channel family protein [Denitratisoma sp. agr-D3]
MFDFVTHAFHLFWTPEEPWLILFGFTLWLFLRRALPVGSLYVLKQTLTFFILSLFGQLAGALMDALGWRDIGAGLYALCVVTVGIALIRFVGLLLFRLILPFLRIETPRILEDLTVTIAYGFWCVIRLRYAGLDPSQIVATSALITAIVAFAMQDTLGNVLGGLAIHLDHSVEIGDWIVLEGVSGRVIDIRWRYTKVATRNGEKVVIPNSFLMKNKFSVVGAATSQATPWRRWIWFNVDFDHPPHRVIEVVERVVREAEIANVAREPSPQVVVMEFGPGYARYALRYWLTDPNVDDPTDSEVRAHVFYALERAGMSLAIPQEVRHIVKENETHEQLLAQREQQRRIDALRGVELFKELSQEELQTLSSHLVHAPFTSGDVITRQGTAADWLYILIAGEADVLIESDHGRQLLTTLKPGSVFGEMGLMTGEPRRATVVAHTDVDCYSLGKTGLNTIIQARPGVAEEISRILSSREDELEKARHALHQSALATRKPSHETLLNRIRDFFKVPG